MTYPTIFTNLAAGNQPLSLFDTMFQVVGQQGAIPCTPSGTNTITLTPGTNYYAPSVLTNGLMVSFLAANTTSGAVTVQLLALGGKNLYTPQGSQAGAGDIANGSHYILQYWSDLNSSAGGWLIISSDGNRVGYGPSGQGIGGTVTQTTSRSTTVTLNKMCGQITLFSATGNAGTWTTFAVTNSLVVATDTVVANFQASTNTYIVAVVAVTASAFSVSYISTAGTAADAPTLNFAVIKSVIT